MREILFRAKSKVKGDWVEGCLVRRYNGYVGIDRPHPDLCFELIQVEPETVGQYTGLKDKNNVKAFEGDIVACNQSGSYGISVIIYDNSAFYVMPLNGNILERTLWDYWYNDWDIEVIGNIHDNPELLEGKQ